MTKEQKELLKALSIPELQKVVGAQRNEFDTEDDENYLMKAGDMRVGFNMPEALRDDGDEDKIHTLPPFRNRRHYLVDEYQGCPDTWPRSQGSLTSYFVPVVEGKGMWLDFNECSKSNYDVAIVISIQGVNAITGMPAEDVILEQYKEECPKHKIKFGPHRFCKKCGFRWPKQNYLSTTATPDGFLWLDGFRASDGVVRQYILTEERLRSVAAAIVGERRVHAIGISFFLSKQQRPPREKPTRGGVQSWANIPFGTPVQYGQPHFFSPVHTPINWQISPSSTSTGVSHPSDSYNPIMRLSESNTKSVGGGTASAHSTWRHCSAPQSVDADSEVTQKHTEFQDIVSNDYSSGLVSSTDIYSTVAVTEQQTEQIEQPARSRKSAVKKLEVGAGAQISQKIYDDPNELDFWREKPEAVLVINYAQEDQVREILSKGRVDVTGSKEGFLDKIPKGNHKKVDK